MSTASDDRAIYRDVPDSVEEMTTSRTTEALATLRRTEFSHGSIVEGLRRR
jgi:hypothetical protein